ncbi:hypothetical protein ABK040_015959 [Willaertia magna]
MKLTDSVELCNLCLEDIDTDEPLQATHHCNDCNKKLCNIHSQLHKVKKSTKDHSLTLLEQQQLTETAISSTSTPTIEQVSSTIIKSTYQAHHYCKHHEGQLMEAYCKDCNDVFCIKCAAFKHKLHDYVDVNEIAKEEEENVKKLISELIIKKEIILQRNDQLKLTITKVKEQLELNKNEINLQFDDLQKELNKKKKEQLLLDMDKIGNEKLHSLQNENQLLDNCSDKRKLII